MRWLLACGLGLSIGLLGALPVAAQPGKQETAPSVKALEAELAKLNAQIKEVEAKLKKAKEAEGKTEGKADRKHGWGRGGPGKRGFGGPRFGKGPHGKHFGPPGFHGKGPFGKGPPGFRGKGPFGKGPGSEKKPESKESSLEKKLDLIQKQLDELRKELKKGK